MTSTKLALLLLLASSMLACKKDAGVAALDQKIVGDWRIIGSGSFHDENGVTVEWGLYYVFQVGLRDDHQFTVNGSSSPAGNWKLTNHDDNIIFYSEYNDVGTIYRDTTEFSISLDKKDQLVLSNSINILTHKRIR